ncbi:MAG: S41 family peptidase [Phycisphaerales bacterium]
MDVSGACVSALAAMFTICMGDAALGDAPASDGPSAGREGARIVASPPTEPAECAAPGVARDSGESERAGSAPAARDLDPARNLGAAIDAIRAYAPLLSDDADSVADAADRDDWGQLLREPLDRVGSDADLFAALVDLLEPLGVHGFVFVRTTDGRSWRRGEAPHAASEGAAIDPTDAIAATYLSSDGAATEGIALDSGTLVSRLRDGTLYARPSGATHGGRDTGLGPVLLSLHRGEPIVLDLRFGDLGARPWSVASLLIDEPVRRPWIERFDPASGAFAGDSESEIMPADARPTGPVILLTNDATRGAAEALVLASMPSLRVTRIGEATSGRFSRPTVVELPNGWRIGLPSQRLVAGNGDSFDGLGVPPHIVALAAPTDAHRGRDAALDAALAYLDRLRQSGLLPAREPAAASALE